MNPYIQLALVNIVLLLLVTLYAAWVFFKGRDGKPTAVPPAVVQDEQP